MGCQGDNFRKICAQLKKKLFLVEMILFGNMNSEILISVKRLFCKLDSIKWLEILMFMCDYAINKKEWAPAWNSNM